MTMEGERSSVYLLHGMKRSGNHAFVLWLRPQLGAMFVNNAIHVGPILRGSKSLSKPMPFDAWKAGREELQDWRGGNLIVGLEDHEPSVSPILGDDVPTRTLLLLRHPEQLFSSRLRHAWHVEMPAFPRENNAVMQRMVAVWKMHARCFLGQGDACPGRVAVSYDAWVADRDYRAAICGALGIGFDDGAFGKVSPYGGGSSFDGMDYQGRGQQMNVLDRSSQLDERERVVLHEIFEDPELRVLSEAVRGADPYERLSGSA